MRARGKESVNVASFALVRDGIFVSESVCMDRLVRGALLSCGFVSPRPG